MMRQQQMVSCYCKKISIIVIVSILLQVLIPATFASHIMWPSESNMYNDLANLDYVIATSATASNSKKGFLLTGDAKEIFTLGAGHVAINVTLSGKGHTFIQYLDGLKKRGVKITLILVNDKPPVGVSGKGAPKDFQNPYCYMIDFFANNGEWQKYNFDRVLADYGPYVDNWVIGNEINSQAYNFYGPSDIRTYTKTYCDSFKIMYRDIKEKNPDANVFISFDQGWDLPQYRKGHKAYDKVNGQYRYNAKEQLELINNFLGKYIDWGLSLHPYPTPVESGKFWDDKYSGFDDEDKIENERPYLITAKNFDVAINYINQNRFLYEGDTPRKVIISELAFTSHDGEEIQAAGLYYIWEKVCKYDDIIALLYNAQTDLPDEYHFGLTSDKNRKRLAWAVFRDMDKGEEGKWCKDLLDRVLDEHGYEDVDGFIFKKITDEEKKAEEEKNRQKLMSKIIIQPPKQ